ncbi:unnamed protein product [Schistosoma margrebowiei]|uniref:Uncharacterized protein n=1 Tax=Schistosoma margrebowiei TaxID=48269 RepID=A0A183LAV3_9TREM|nr:unnamed protein product [Schistosoma margrebowiei]
MVVGGSQQEILYLGFVLLGTRQQGVPVILREPVLPDGFDLVSPSFTVRDVTTELSEPIKDISQERIWSTSGILQVQVKCTCEIQNASRRIDLKHALKTKYKHVIWCENELMITY